MKSRLLRASHLAARWAPLCLLAPLPVLAQALPATAAGAEVSLALASVAFRVLPQSPLLAQASERPTSPTSP